MFVCLFVCLFVCSFVYFFLFSPPFFFFFCLFIFSFLFLKKKKPDSGKRMILLKNPSPPMRFSPYSPNSENPHLQYPPTLSPIVNPQPGPGTLPGPSAVSSPPLEVLSSPLRKTHSPTSSKSPLLTLAESTTLPPPFSPLAGGAPSPLSQHTSPQKSPSPTDQIMVVRRGGEQPPQNLSTSKSLVFPKKQERVMSPLGQIASSNLN